MRAFLIVLVILKWLALTQQVTAHDAFYPHHSQDFSPTEIKQRDDLKITVLIITLIFVVMMTILIYFAFSQTSKISTTQQESDQHRLNQLANQAVEVALQELKANGTINQAISDALAAYASNTGVSWYQQPITGDRVRCKIGSNVVIISVNSQQIEMYINSKDNSTQVIKKLT